MSNSAKKKDGIITVVIILALLIVTFLVFWINHFEILKVQEFICNKFLEVIGVYGVLIGLLFKSRRKIMGIYIDDNEDIKKIKEDSEKQVEAESQNITLPQTINSKNKIENKDTKISSLIKIFQEGNYLKLLQDAKCYFETEHKFVYRVFIEFAYSGLDHSYIDDRISNLKILVNENKVKDKKLQVSFMFNYLKLNIIKKNFNLDKIIYDIIDFIKENNLPSKYLYDIYFQKMHLCILNNMPNIALSAAHKALIYTSSNSEKFEIYYCMARLYLYFLKDTIKTEEVAELAWGIIDNNITSKNIENLLIIYYFALFFNGKVGLACETITNYLKTNKKQSEYIDKIKEHLSYLMYKNNQISEAKTLAKEYISSNTATSINTLAMIEKDEEKYDSAIAKFTRILPDFEKDKKDKFAKYFWLEILHNRAFCYTQIKEYNKAKKDIDIVLKEGFPDIDFSLLEKLHYENTQKEIAISNNS